MTARVSAEVKAALAMLKADQSGLMTPYRAALNVGVTPSAVYAALKRQACRNLHRPNCLAQSIFEEN